MEFDTVAAVLMGSDLGHGAIDIAHLDRRGRQADDAAGWESLLVLSDVGTAAVAINAVDDEIAPVAMLVGETGGNDPADDRLVLRRIEQGMALGWAVNACFPKLAIQGPDDVAPFAHAPQPGLQFAVERPAPVSAFLGKAEPGQRAQPPNERSTLARIGLGDGDDAFFIRFSHQRPVDAGETLLLNLPCYTGGDLLLGPGAKVEGDDLGRPGAKALGHIVPGDNQVLAGLVLPRTMT